GMGTAAMGKLNYYNATWSLDEAQCPCDVHFLEYLKERRVRNAAIFHFGSGNHHIVGLKAAEDGANNAVLSITASPQEYDDYVELLIRNPRLGHTYKAYFGDIYQLDARLLPEFDYVTLFHVGEFRTPHNDSYGALTDLEMTLVLADKVKAEGEILFYSGSYAYDKAQACAAELVRVRPFAPVADFKSLRVYKKRI
ncbi:MAG: hypothetical protein J2P50_13980, partial [Hyphomicrobiaceae bacterium]|nr:hypothetical protein [Hyphomicrobiaceae bacterium]